MCLLSCITAEKKKKKNIILGIRLYLCMFFTDLAFSWFQLFGSEKGEKKVNFFFFVKRRQEKKIIIFFLSSLSPISSCSLSMHSCTPKIVNKFSLLPYIYLWSPTKILGIIKSISAKAFCESKCPSILVVYLLGNYVINTTYFYRSLFTGEDFVQNIYQLHLLLYINVLG